MERFVRKPVALLKFSLVLYLLTLIAIKVFGAPVMIFAYVYFGELMAVGALDSWYRKHRPRG